MRDSVAMPALWKQACLQFSLQIVFTSDVNNVPKPSYLIFVMGRKNMSCHLGIGSHVLIPCVV